jgi:Zn-dependent peptidase ImmA (M78 family)
MSLTELTDGVNPFDEKIYKDIAVDIKKDFSNTVKIVREYLGIPLKEQIKWKDSNIALKSWRDVIQNKGVFVFKDSIKQKEVSGFCLTDRVFPIIYLNNSLHENRQIFTLFHELAHILLNANGLTKQDDRYIDDLNEEQRKIEIFSNRFAGEFLVPTEDFAQFTKNIPDDQTIEITSRRYKVSREVILRRFLNSGVIDKSFYLLKVSQYQNDTVRKKNKVEGSGGDYYATQAAYLGSQYLKLAFSKYHQGRVSLEQLGDCLNIKPKFIDKIESELYSKGQIYDLHI